MALRESEGNIRERVEVEGKGASGQIAIILEKEKKVL